MKCPNCGAPISTQKNQCEYCGTKYEIRKPQEREVCRQTNENEASLHNDGEGCLRMLLTLGMISLFTRPRGPRRRF